MRPSAAPDPGATKGLFRAGHATSKAEPGLPLKTIVQAWPCLNAAGDRYHEGRRECANQWAVKCPMFYFSYERLPELSKFTSDEKRIQWISFGLSAAVNRSVGRLVFAWS
jgi:hypothetical protein